MPTISVIIIVKNEESAIGECLASIGWANEVIIVDSGSTDRTIEICNSYGAKVSTTKDWPGFGKQKNRALALATGEWVLSIDADERVTKQLRDEILTTINKSTTNVAFRIPRKSSYCGQFINHSGWWPDYVTRLFPRSGAKFSDDLVHERVLFDGEIKTLIEPLVHISHTDLEEVLDKTNRYSSYSAAMLYARGEKASLSKAILHSFWAFIRTYIFRRGFLDGRIGFILAISYAETTYYRYLKLMMLASKKESL
jgi:glycosyltransferase involved in cell wall biosynthesis